jgi:hypothetical protein
VAEKSQSATPSKQATLHAAALANADVLNLQIQQFLQKRVDQRTGQYSIQRFKRRLQEQPIQGGTGLLTKSLELCDHLFVGVRTLITNGCDRETTPKSGKEKTPSLEHAPREPGAFVSPHLMRAWSHFFRQLQFMFWHDRFDETTEGMHRRLATKVCPSFVCKWQQSYKQTLTDRVSCSSNGAAI